MQKFIEKHEKKILGALTCVDRIIFKGYLPITDEKSMTNFFYTQEWLIKDFKHIAPRLSGQIAEHAKALACKHGRPYEDAPVNRCGVNKEDYARAIAERDGITRGLVCVLRTMEPCLTFRVRVGEKRPHLAMAKRKCRFFYFYYMDREFGLMHIRLQGWLPFPVQIYINGHEWLAKKMDRYGIGYEKHDNAFTAIDDLPRAQRFANRFAKKNWPRVLETLARRVNTHMEGLLKDLTYYWVCDQCEIATDVMFKRRADLKDLYPQWVKQATLCFTAEDVLTFLGKKLHGNFKGEATNDYKVRTPGARVKHVVKGNWIKMYDKAGRILRIETVINQPREFKVRRLGKRKGEWVTGWFPMNKGVANLPPYVELGTAACGRYLQALALVDDPARAMADLRTLTTSRTRQGRRVRGLNPVRQDDALLFAAAMRGEHCIHGFRNRDLVAALYPKPVRAKTTARKRSRKITRQINMLRVHGLVVKLPNSRRYRVTTKGKRLMSASILLHKDILPARLAS